MFDALRRRRDARRTPEPPAAGTAGKGTTRGTTKGTDTTKGAATTRKQGPRS
jgi:hypothetical protein